jgi:hypothetical protein
MNNTKPNLVQYKPNLTKIEFKSLTLYFSYSECIGFQIDNNEPVFSENIWSLTTAKHLNFLGSKKEDRLPREQFLERLEGLHHVNYS